MSWVTYTQQVIDTCLDKSGKSYNGVYVFIGSKLGEEYAHTASTDNKQLADLIEGAQEDMRNLVGRLNVDLQKLQSKVIEEREVYYPEGFTLGKCHFSFIRCEEISDDPNYVFIFNRKSKGNEKALEENDKLHMYVEFTKNGVMVFIARGAKQDHEAGVKTLDSLVKYLIGLNM